MSLLDSVKGVVSNAVIDKAADVLGVDNGMAKSAMKMFLPAIIGGVINKGSSPSGAGGLLDLFKNGGFGNDNLGDLTSILGNEDKRSSWLSTGSDLLGTLFGNNRSGVTDMLIKATGMKDGLAKTLLTFLAPIVINKLAGIVSNKNMGAADLSNYLNDQKSDIMTRVPGLAGFLGGATASTGVATGSTNTNSEGGGGGLLKWLLPLLLAAAAIWFFTKDGCNKTVESTDTTTVEVEDNTTTQATTNTTARELPTATEAGTTTTVDTEADFSGYTVTDNLDIVSPSGAVLHSAGSYDVDAKDNILDTNGRIIMPAASLSDDFKTKLRSMFDQIRLARMKMMFGDMIVKKSGAKTSYGLSDIQFNTENHRISSFSKAEVEGLAAALKANATGKIEVQVNTADGKNAKDNNKLSETRAKVIRDMLVTLGVSEKQISAVGMGSENEAKAKIGKVDIVVK